MDYPLSRIRLSGLLTAVLGLLRADDGCTKELIRLDCSSSTPKRCGAQPRSDAE
jgi:hypothetical protein